MSGEHGARPPDWAERVYHVTQRPPDRWHVQSERRVPVKWLVRVQDIVQHKHTHFPTRLCSQTALTAKVNARLVMEKLDGQINERTSGITHTDMRTLTQPITHTRGKKSHAIKHRGNYPMSFLWIIRKRNMWYREKKRKKLHPHSHVREKVKEKRQRGRRQRDKRQKQRNTQGLRTRNPVWIQI